MERLTNTRFESLDAMRGLASLAVVIFHIGSNEFQPYWLKFIATYGEVGVQLFFVLSGFIISFTSFKYLQPSTTMGSVQFMTKRFIRVYPPFFLSMILCIIVNYCLDNEIIKKSLKSKCLIFCHPVLLHTLKVWLAKRFCLSAMLIVNTNGFALLI